MTAEVSTTDLIATLRSRIDELLPDPYTLGDLRRIVKKAIREMTAPYADQIIVERDADDPTRVNVLVPVSLLATLNALRGQ